MQRQPLGRSGLQVAPWAFGGNVFGWTADDPDRLLDAFVDLGFDLVDTADVYSAWVPGHTGGESETAIGRWLAKGGGRRGKSRESFVWWGREASAAGDKSAAPHSGEALQLPQPPSGLQPMARS